MEKKITSLTAVAALAGFKNYFSGKKIEYDGSAGTTTKEYKNGKFYKLMSTLAMVANGIFSKTDFTAEKVTRSYVGLPRIRPFILKIGKFVIKAADLIATLFTKGKTVPEKVGGMIGLTIGNCIAGVICNAVGVGMHGVFPMISSIVANTALMTIPNKFIAFPLCLAILAGTAYFAGLPATASTFIYCLIYDIVGFKIGPYLGKKIGNMFSKSIKAKKNGISPPPNNT